MRRRCVLLYEANGGHTRYWLVFWFWFTLQAVFNVPVCPIMWNP
jgi:hypothetical protein